jgi:dimethylargininase
MLTAITRQVSPAIANCELTYLARAQIDLNRARAQHRAYARALSSVGCEVIELPPEPSLPDSVFVEDAAVVLDELALITRPGPASRRPETVTLAKVLSRFRDLVTIEDPGTLEGGDVLRVGRVLYVGKSGRTNAEGIRQLGVLAEHFGYVVTPVEVHGCLHLKSAVTQVGAETLLFNPEWVDKGSFEGFDFVPVDPREPYAANAIRVGGSVLHPSSFPRTRERLEARGIKTKVLDVSELQKAEGALTCCSLIFEHREHSVSA